MQVATLWVGVTVIVKAITCSNKKLIQNGELILNGGAQVSHCTEGFVARTDANFKLMESFFTTIHSIENVHLVHQVALSQVYSPPGISGPVG